MKKIQGGIPGMQVPKNPVVKKLVEESQKRQKELGVKTDDIQKQRTSNKLPVDFTKPIKVLKFTPVLDKSGEVKAAVMEGNLYLTKKENVITADGKHAQHDYIVGEYHYRVGRQMKTNELFIDMYELLLGKDFQKAHVEFGKLAMERINAINKKAKFQQLKDTRLLQKEENKTTKPRTKK